MDRVQEAHHSTPLVTGKADQIKTALSPWLGVR